MPMRARRVYLGLGFLTAAILHMVFVPLAVYYVQVVGLDPLQLVLVGTALELTVFALEVPTGVVADVYSRRLSVIIGEVLIGVCFLIEGFVPVFGALVLAEVVRGTGETFCSGALEAWIADELGQQGVAQVYLRYGQMRKLGSLLGMALGAGLGSLSLRLPIVLGGALMVCIGAGLAIAMPEHAFRPLPPERRRSWRALTATLQHGVRVVRRNPVALSLLSVAAILGAHSEGYMRLREAHVLRNLTFPTLPALPPVVWFSLIEAGSGALGAVATGWAARRAGSLSERQMARVLATATALAVPCLLAFALVRGFGWAVLAWLAIDVLGSLTGPLMTTWLNLYPDSTVRATVISMLGQADALGQFVGGPIVGAIGTLFSLRSALLVAGLFLCPAVWVYARLAGAALPGRPRPSSAP